MTLSIDDQIERLKHTIAEMEAQRETLGAELIDNALVPLKHKLEELIQTQQAQIIHRSEKTPQQRKLVTLLFMDIAGSTSIAQHMDPEDVSEVFDVALKQLAQPVAAHGGHVTRFMGDGFLAVFGAPSAREDDPEQAVRAGLAILELSRQVGAELEHKWHIPAFQVREGVNTGLVMLGGETEAADTLMGAAVNLAARLESAAPPGGLLVSHATYRHIRGVFDVEPREPILAKGFDETVKVYRVLRARPRAFRMYTRGVEGIETSMVGRETELKYLQDALLNAIEEGEGHMVTLTGEAGVGKSRLLYEFQDWIELLPPPPVRFYEGRAHPEAISLPCGLLRDLFASRFQVQEDDRVETVCEKVSLGFAEGFGSHPDGEMRAHLLGQWLGFDFTLSPHLKDVIGDPEQLRNRGRMYLGEYFNRISSQSPVVIFLEDIHWADDSSLDALNWLGERLHQQQTVIVCATRPMLFERRPYWGEGLPYHHRLELEPLSKRESRQLVLEILKLVENLPPELRELVVEGAEGNPFYVEELVKMLVDDGVIVKGDETWQVLPTRLTEIQVPPTLAGVLQARLDSLSDRERTVLQQASVVGRLFWDSVVAYIQAAEERRETVVPEALTALRSRELIYRREESAFAEAREYIFKHDILREVTYESVLKRLRKVYHGLVADWLIAHADKLTAEYSGLIAGHLLQAERTEQAGEYFLRAGESALSSYANGEAEAHFRKALELLPGSASCLAGLGEALGRQAHRQEAVPILRQAVDLFLQQGDYDRAAHQYSRLSQVVFYIENQKAWEVCQEGLLRLEGKASSAGLARLLAEAGRTAFFRGHPNEEVMALCQRAIAIADQCGELEARAEASINLASSLADMAPERSIQILQEVIAFTESKGFWEQASRAHFALYMGYGNAMLSLETAYEHGLKAVQISVQTGNLDRAFMALENVAQCLIELGRLGIVIQKLEDVLRGIAVPHARAEEFLAEQREWLLFYQGEWEPAVKGYRQRLHKFREADDYSWIAIYNSLLAFSNLELDNLMGTGDLVETELAVRENIAINKFVSGSRSYLVSLLSRQQRFAEAHDVMAEVVASIVQPEAKLNMLDRFDAEAELALAEGRLDEAVATYQTLVNQYMIGGCHWQYARRLISLGDALTRRDAPGDLEQARAAYQQALEMFRAMPAPGYVQVLEQRLGQEA